MTRFKLNLLAAAALLTVAVLGVGGGVRGVSAEPPVGTPVARAPAPAAAPAVAPRPAPDLAAADDDEKKEDAIDRREGVVKSVDPTARKLVLVTDDDKFELNVDVADKAEVRFARRPAALTDLKAGMRGHVEFKGADKQAFRVEAHWPKLDTVVKAADPAKNSLTVKTEGNNGFEFEAVLAVAADARVEVEGLPGGLADLPAGSNVRVEFAADKKTVVGIDADAQTGELSGSVKAADPTGKTLTLTLLVSGLRDERRVDLSFAVAADVKVRLSGKDAALADLTAEMPVRARFAADRRTITAIWAAPPRPKEKDDDAPR